MGDGGVACMPLQQHQHQAIMERCPVAEKTLCGGSSNGLNSKPVKLEETQQQQPPPRKKKKVIKVKKVIVVKKKVVEKKEPGLKQKSELGTKEKGEVGKKSTKEPENRENSEQKEEVEEGELGTLKWPREAENGQVLADNSEKIEPEKGQIPVVEECRKAEPESGQLVSSGRNELQRGKIVYERKGEAEKRDGLVNGESIMGKWSRAGKGEVEKEELRPQRGTRNEIEKGEFIPERWHRVNTVKDDYNCKARKSDSGKEKGWKYERDATPDGKYSGNDVYCRKEISRSGFQHSKSFSRWEGGHERTPRIFSKIVDEQGLRKSDYSHGKKHGREYSSGNRLKRPGADTDSIDRKHHGDLAEYSSAKNRRLSDDNSRTIKVEHYSRHSAERSYRNSSLSRKSSSEKYSSRHHESSFSARVHHEKHGRSPGYPERSPHDRVRNYDHQYRSPGHGERSPHTNRSSNVRERSPHVHEKSLCARDRSLHARERSPHDRTRHHYHRHRSPASAEQSPKDQVRSHDRRDRTPYLERSPNDQSRQSSYQKKKRKNAMSETLTSNHSSEGQDDQINQVAHGSIEDLNSSPKEDQSNSHETKEANEKNPTYDLQKEKHAQSPKVISEGSPHADGVPPEELQSMEEDMDICDTPPHNSVVAESSLGKWIYLDYLGLEHGPSKLCEVKALVEEGSLLSDHFIKHLDSDRWVTVENAVSPLVSANFSSIASDCITQLVSPPEAPGNVLAESGEQVQVDVQNSTEMAVSNGSVPLPEPLEDLLIDKRIEALLCGYVIIPGRELETIGEVLCMTFDQEDWMECGNYEGLTSDSACLGDFYAKTTDKPSGYSEMNSKDIATFRLSTSSDGFSCADSGDWFFSRWASKGGDWKRSDEAAHDRDPRKKLVLNDGFPLCQMAKSGHEDPRWHQKDDLYFPLHGKRLDLPPWAFSIIEDRNDCNNLSRSGQTKAPIPRSTKGTVLPVVRINACVVQDHGSFVSESRTKARGKDKYSSRTSRSHSASNDLKRSLAESNFQSKTVNDHELQSSQKCIASIITPKDRVGTADDLQLHLGEWFYLDGAGHEQGPLLFAELQALANQGIIQKHSTVFRKFDKIWVPISSEIEAFKSKTRVENSARYSDSSGSSRPQGQPTLAADNEMKPRSFHSIHPQFIGYTRGKLHELVMKSYKSREFTAAISEVLDPWINAKQPKKDMEKLSFRKSEDVHAAKRARLMAEGFVDGHEMEEIHSSIRDDSTFEDLCGGFRFSEEKIASPESVGSSWALLDGHVLTRIFHFLKSDLKSLSFASLTCKHWRAAARFYKGISKQVDLSSLGSSCVDSMMWSIMNGYSKEKINSVVLMGCTSVTPSALEELLHVFPSLCSLDIRGCSQFGDVVLKFPHVNWLKNRSLQSSEEFSGGIRSLNQFKESISSVSKKGLSGNVDDFGELKDYFERDSSFRRSLYRRSKVFDARKSSSISSRDARIRQWAMKKSENEYKRIEQFLASSLRDIMKENAFDFFVPKVAEIEEKMKNGYYVSHGLNSVKEDISRMCRDAIKAKGRGAGTDMNRIITLFIQLATRLEQGARITSSYERDELIRMWKDGNPSAVSKYKKNYSKLNNERKYTNRSNGSSFTNGTINGECASDREIRKRLSKLNRKSMGSESETSDDLDQSSEECKSSASTSSDTESDLDFCSALESRVDGYAMVDDGVEPTTDDREWGARMTKASLVPPVTRKYEVIDQYLVVADEEDVQRKMSVSLPEDYAEKLNAQKSGSEELDMELPEVKDYRPRKSLGDEVIEQEVYGIDPYSHNLLLDSMPEELDWPLLEKHLFIEDVLLRTLNKQVRHFTGTGNTPMIYPLQPVIEEIKRVAEEDCDIRTMRMCQGLLRAIEARPDDSYVAYRKGLGVVCNKESGFGEEDFVVEFLGEVYPVWKWFEKQDGIRSLQKNNKDAPEFYNIYLERPKGDADGYDLVVVDAMHKANYASRICHSCRPNCEAKVTAVDGHYQIGIYTLREIQYGEEITFDYNSVTESKEEYEASVCLCGSQVCRGSYLNLTGEGAFQKVLEEWHGILDRQQLMLEACELNSVSEEDCLDLGRAGFGSCLLGGLPDWLIAYSARLVRFINFERTKLPEEILRHNLEEKRKYFLDTCLEVEKSDAEIQAEGVYNQRLQNLAVTLDKVRYVLRCMFGDPKKAPPPLERLNNEEVIDYLWKGEGSLVQELLESVTHHVEENLLNELKAGILAHDPSGSGDIQKGLRKSLLWLRDEVRDLPCTYKCRNDAAADLIHVYAYTKCFFRIREYKALTSPPVYISSLDLGPKYADKFTVPQEFRKTYGENYCLGQLIYWYNQTNSDPDRSLFRASKGCLSLPEIGSFYAKVQKPSRNCVYGPKTVKFMLSRMEKHPQRAWPKDRIWSFRSCPKVLGSPMMDAVINNSPLDREMVQWLRHRRAMFQAMWDR